MSACSTPTDCARPQTSQRPAFRRTPWTLSPASPRCCCPTAAESPSHHCTSARAHNRRAAHGRVCRSPRRIWGRDACQGRTTTPRRHTDARRRRRSRMRAPANHARETPRPDLCPPQAILCTAIERSDGADRQPQVTALTHVGSGGRRETPGSDCSRCGQSASTPAFPPLATWPENFGATGKKGQPVQKGGFAMGILDVLHVPATLPPGDYVLGCASPSPAPRARIVTTRWLTSPSPPKHASGLSSEPP